MFWAGTSADVAKPNTREPITFFDAKIRTAFDNRAKELGKSRPTTTLRGPNEHHRVTTCTDLLRRVKSGPPLEQIEVDRVFSEYKICLVLGVLEQAQAPRISYFDHQALGSDFLKKLNLATLHSSLYPRAPSPKDGFRFSDFTFSSVKTSSHSLELADEDWNYAVIALAAADFDRDGVEDLVVYFYDDSKSGTYFQLTTLILSRTTPNGWITATEALRALAGTETRR